MARGGGLTARAGRVDHLGAVADASRPERPCCPPGRPCGPSRRELLAYGGAAGVLWGARPGAVPGREDFPIPAEKGFSEAWRRALVERGEPQVVTGRALRRIGMPIGGIACGQLYLGGDGRLWHWDLFNQPCPPGFDSGSGPHYARPLEPGGDAPLGLSIHVQRRAGGAALPLGTSAFDEVEFRGTYPIGTVTYRSRSPALEAELEAFSPFVPLELEDSSLPVTFLRLRVRNLEKEPIRVTLRGTLDNLVLRSAADDWLADFVRTSRSLATEGIGVVIHEAQFLEPGEEERPDIPFEDFERDDFAGWTVEGTAFGDGPVAAADLPDYQGQVGAEGRRLAHSHHARGGEDVRAADAHVGTLTSREFTVERLWVNLLLDGGNHPGETCVEVLVDGKVVGTVTGRDENRLRPCSLYVGDFLGRKARIRIADRARGGWGNVGVDSIVFSDRQRTEPLDARGDHGSMALGILGPGWESEIELPASGKGKEPDPTQPERGSVARSFALEPGDAGEATFVLAWHFPNLWRDKLGFLPDLDERRRHYAERFADVEAVVRHVAAEQERLQAATRAWRDAWYDSSLPHWLLDRTFASASTLATATCLRFDDGRFYGWEGAYCCAGTCTHVWQYAQAAARLFPALERDQRERVDLGLAFHPDSGQIDYRAEAARSLAVDGQAGTVLRVWREHLTAPDDAFLRRVWPRARKALECLLTRDPDQDGILDGAQYNTLDATWYGAIPWLSSLYLAAVRAGELMAEELGDGAFAATCRAVREAGARSMVTRLFEEGYFVQRLDPEHPEANATGAGCSIDQVYGQAWAHQVGLGRILPEEETRSALRALWRHNFAPDVGPYRDYMKARIEGGRWYAMPGEAGLLMCTWPRGGHEVATGKGQEAWAAGYFNECMTGFEHQAAAHMLWEGLVEEGLAVERAIHERYDAAKRNPWNEVECGDHYARAMASYGVFLAACGFELHGPRGHLGFDPRLTPENFRAAFVAAEGWGSYSQRIGSVGGLAASLELRHGRLRLATLRIGHGGRAAPTSVQALVGKRAVSAELVREPRSALVRFAEPLELVAGETLSLELHTG